MYVQGNINTHNFTQLISNTVLTTTTTPIKNIQFEELSVHNLTAHNVDVHEINYVANLPVEIYRDIVVNETIPIEHLYFDNYLNDIPANFMDSKPYTRGDVPEDNYFENVTVYGQAYVSSNEINHINLKHLVDDTVKIYEDHVFETGVFGKSTSLNYLSSLIIYYFCNFFSFRF